MSAGAHRTGSGTGTTGHTDERAECHEATGGSQDPHWELSTPLGRRTFGLPEDSGGIRRIPEICRVRGSSETGRRALIIDVYLCLSVFAGISTFIRVYRVYRVYLGLAYPGARTTPGL